MKLKVCHIIITTQGPILDKYVKAFTQNADDTVAKDVKTLSVLVQNFNKMIGSAYKTVIAPLNNITWSATFDLITMIPTEMTKNLIKAYAVSTQTCQRDIWAFYKLATVRIYNFELLTQIILTSI